MHRRKVVQHRVVTHGGIQVDDHKIAEFNVGGQHRPGTDDASRTDADVLGHLDPGMHKPVGRESLLQILDGDFPPPPGIADGYNEAHLPVQLLERPVVVAQNGDAFDVIFFGFGHKSEQFNGPFAPPVAVLEEPEHLPGKASGPDDDQLFHGVKLLDFSELIKTPPISLPPKVTPVTQIVLRYRRAINFFFYFCLMQQKIRTWYLIFALLLPTLPALAQTGYVWTNSVGGPNFSEFGLDVACDPLGNVILVGEYLDQCRIGDSVYATLGDNDMFIAKYDPQGNPLWVRVQGSPQLDRLYGVDAGPEGDIYIAGYGKVNFPMQRTSIHARDALIARYRPNGDLAWGHNLDGDIFSEAQDIVGLADRGCYVTGEYETTTWLDSDTLEGNGGADAYLMRYDSAGNYLWGRTIGGSLNDKPWALGVDAQENVYLGGLFSSSMMVGNDLLISAGGSDAFIAKFDPNGTPVWAKAFHGPLNDFVFAMKTSPGGATYFAGTFETELVFGSDTLTGSSGDDIFYGKLDPQGDLLWWHAATGSSIDAAQDLEIDCQENVYIGGYFFGTLNWDTVSVVSAGFDDMFFSKLDSAGNLIFFETSHYPDTRDVFGLGVDPAQNLLLTGAFIQLIDLGGDTIQAVNNSIDIFLTKYATRNTEIQLDSLTGSPFCGGDQFQVHFRAYGDFDSSNVFYLELSDASGNFAQPDTVGVRNGGFGGTVTGTIPPGLPLGTGYRVRLASSAPGIITPDNGFDITLDPTTAIPVQIMGDSVLCNGIPILLEVDQGFVSQTWSTGDTNYFIVVTAPGVYTVEAIDTSGCSNQDLIDVQSCVSVSAPKSAVDLTVFPNPSRETVRIEGEGAGAWSLRLIDLAGREVWRDAFRAGNMRWRRGLNLMHLPRGMYLLQGRLDERRRTLKLLLE